MPLREMLLVLAIAGLILVVVFLAVGGAQRANRDTQRVNEAGQMAAALESYARNNNGAYPTTTLAASYTAAIKDVDTNGPGVYSASDITAATRLTDGIHYASGYVCSGGTPSVMTTVGASVRTYAISYWSEQSNSAICKDNK